MSLQKGDQIAGKLHTYTIGDLLDRGGMGSVHDSRDERRRRYAVKELRVDQLTEEEQAIVRRGFQQEVKALAALHHPRIPKLIEYVDIDGTPVIVMEFIKGKRLTDIAAPCTPADEVRALCWLRDIAEAVQACHRVQIEPGKELGRLHGDIKPDNILIKCCQWGEERAYLVDFGVSVPARVSEKTQRHGGQDPLRHAHTALFSAPEKFGIRAEIGIASDVFSIGATFHKLFTGKPPEHHVDRWLNVEQKRISAVNPQISKELDDLIYRCIALDPKVRPELAEVLEVARAPLVTTSRAYVRLPEKKNSDNDINAFIAPIIKGQRPSGRPDAAPGPKYVASIGDGHLLAGWPDGRIERIRVDTKLRSGRSWFLGFQQLDGMTTYTENGRIGCLAFGTQQGHTRIALIPDVCGRKSKLPEILTVDRNVRHVWRDADRFYLLYEDNGAVWIGEAPVRRDTREPMQVRDAVKVPDCHRALTGLSVSDEAVFVVGTDQDGGGHVWKLDRVRGEWEQWPQIGKLLAIARRDDYLWLVYKRQMDVFIATTAVQTWREALYRPPGLCSFPDSLSLAFDEAGRHLWIAVSGKLYRVPHTWVTRFPTRSDR